MLVSNDIKCDRVTTAHETVQLMQAYRLLLDQNTTIG